MKCDALKILVQVLDNSNSCSNSTNSSSSIDSDNLIKYVPLSLKLLAAALGVRNPKNDTGRTPDCEYKLHEHLDETRAGSDTVHSTTEVSKVAGNKSIRNEHGSFFCVILHVLYVLFCVILHVLYVLFKLHLRSELQVGGYHVSGE